MAYTVAYVEGVLLRRCKAAMGVVSLDVTTNNGSNPDLADPIRQAATAVHLRLADPTTVADADLACLRPHHAEKLLDLAERRTLETVLSAFLYVDQSDGNNKKANDQFRKGLQARIAELTARVALPYGPAFGRVRIGRDEPHRRWSLPGAGANVACEGES